MKKRIKVFLPIFALSVASANNNLQLDKPDSGTSKVTNAKVIKIFEDMYAKGTLKNRANLINLSKVTTAININPSKVVTTSKNSTKKVVKLAANNKKITKVKIDKKKKVASKITNYLQFKNSINLKKSYRVYEDKTILRHAKGRNSTLIIDVSLQRIKMLVNNKVAIDAPCTTGSRHKFEPNTRTYRDKHTPYGTFKIREKIANKRSTIFVNIYRHGKLVYHGDKRKYRGSYRGARVVGAPLYNWMRLTSGGIGLHASNHVKRYPGSNGCIRLPMKVAKKIFRKVALGTVVKVVR